MVKKNLFSTMSQVISATIPVCLLFLYGCGGETRYTDNTRISDIAQDERATAQYATKPNEKATAQYHYDRNEKSKVYSYDRNNDSSISSHTRQGNTYTIDQYERATAEYTLRKRGDAHFQDQRVARQTSGDTTVTSQETMPPPPLVLDITDVLFEFDKWTIRKKYHSELDKWAEFFQKNPKVEATIYGHADSTGPTLYNQKLSEKRAQAVVDYLVDQGVAASRLKAIGFGETKPLVPNTTKENREKNRRVEMDY